MRVQHTPARTLALKAVAFIGEFTGILAVENDCGLCVDYVCWANAYDYLSTSHRIDIYC